MSSTQGGGDFLWKSQIWLCTRKRTRNFGFNIVRAFCGDETAWKKLKMLGIHYVRIFKSRYCQYFKITSVLVWSLNLRKELKKKYGEINKHDGEIEYRIRKKVIKKTSVYCIIFKNLLEQNSYIWNPLDRNLKSEWRVANSPFHIFG